MFRSFSTQFLRVPSGFTLFRKVALGVRAFRIGRKHVFDIHGRKNRRHGYGYPKRRRLFLPGDERHNLFSEPT